MDCEWQEAKTENAPIVAYHCYLSTLPTFKMPVKPTSKEKQASQTAFDLDLDVNVDEGVTEMGERQSFMVRLPYTIEMLRRRYSEGKSTPDFIAANDLKPKRKTKEKRRR